MKVNKPNVSSAGTAAVSGKAAHAAKSKSMSGPEKSSVGGSVNVNVSERAQMMQKAKDIAGKDSIDEAKVARLQKLIDSGQYSVDASAIADRLVDEHLATSD